MLQTFIVDVASSAFSQCIPNGFADSSLLSRQQLKVGGGRGGEEGKEEASRERRREGGRDKVEEEQEEETHR